MPWIHATLSGDVDDLLGLARDLARVTAAAAGLEPSAVIVLVTIAAASAGSGAIVTISGRGRTAEVESAIAAGVRLVVADATGNSHDVIAVVRWA